MEDDDKVMLAGLALGFLWSILTWVIVIAGIIFLARACGF